MNLKRIPVPQIFLDPQLEKQPIGSAKLLLLLYQLPVSSRPFTNDLLTSSLMSITDFKTSFKVKLITYLLLLPISLNKRLFLPLSHYFSVRMQGHLVPSEGLFKLMYQGPITWRRENICFGQTKKSGLKIVSVERNHVQDEAQSLSPSSMQSIHSMLGIL